MEEDELIKHSQSVVSTNKNTDTSDLSKKLHATKAELEDLKLKFGALKRNYDAIANHSAKDSIETVRLQKMKEDFE